MKVSRISDHAEADSSLILEYERNEKWGLPTPGQRGCVCLQIVFPPTDARQHNDGIRQCRRQMYNMVSNFSSRGLDFLHRLLAHPGEQRHVRG